MSQSISIARLADHRGLIPQLAGWFRQEWPDWYGPDGPGDAEADLTADANADALPVGLVAFADGEVCGVAALRATSIDTHTHLSPWAVAGYVRPALRRGGVGARLLAALEEEALRLGFDTVYCATATSASLLDRAHWRLIETVTIHGVAVAVYAKTVA